jgi:hypothetical protein
MEMHKELKNQVYDFFHILQDDMPIKNLTVLLKDDYK